MLASIAHRTKGSLASAAFCLAVASLPSPARSQTMRAAEEIRPVVAIEGLSVKDGVVSGEVRNLSARPLRDVQLFIRHTWIWNDELHPGKMDPGTSTFYTVPQEIAPGGMARFSVTPEPPLAQAPGGRFITTVSVAGFTEIVPQTR